MRTMRRSRRRGLAAGAALATAMAAWAVVPAAAQAGAAGPAPRFEEHAVRGVEQGRRAPLDPASHPRAAELRRRLRDGLSPPANFAGHLALVARECGRGCQDFLLVDVRTGRVFDGLGEVPPVHFRANSRLLVVEPPEPAPGRPRCAGCTAAYYLWTGDGLTLVWPRGPVGVQPPPAGARGVLESRRSREAPLLARAGGRVSRPAWNRLVIATAGGERRVFEDDVVAGELLRSHRLLERVPALDAFVVERTYYPEGRQLFLVDAARGEVTEVDEVPVPSPDGARFVTASLDLVAGHRPNRIRVYRRGEGAPRVEWETSPRGWGATRPVWEGPARVRLERVEVDASTAPLGTRTSTLRLERAGAGWRIAPAAPARRAPVPRDR